MQIFGMTGEPLGVIGGQHASKEEDQPEWKKILASTPSVSIRKGIAMGSDHPTELTSTLVLTSKKSYYVDVRFSLTGSSPTSGPDYWSFAGTAESIFPPSPHPLSFQHIIFPCSIHSTWTRFVDSRGDIATPDQGTSFLLHDGSVLELGEMEDPKTGTKTAYQEIWASPEEKDLPDVMGQGLTYPETGSMDVSAARSKLPVIVALYYRASTDLTPQGMIIRVGGFCQGIVATGAHPIVLVERWGLQKAKSSPSLLHSAERKAEDTLDAVEGAEDHDVWIRDPRSNYHVGPNTWMPCKLMCGGEDKPKFHVGESLTRKSPSSSGSWKIVEAEY